MYRDRLVRASVLTSLATSSHTHPLGRGFLHWVDWQYFNGVLVVFSESMEELSCQRCGVFMIELKQGHASLVIGWRLDR